MRAHHLRMAKQYTASGASLAFITSSTSTGGSITVPASVQQGDLLLFYQGSANIGSFPTLIWPSGFTTIYNSTVDGFFDIRVAMGYKIATGLEAGTVVTGMDGSSDSKLIAVFRKSAGSCVVSSISTPSVYGGSGDAPPQTINASGQTPIILAIAQYYQSTKSTRSFTPAQDAILVSTNTEIYYKIYNPGSTPQNITVDQVDGGDQNSLVSFYIKIT